MRVPRPEDYCNAQIVNDMPKEDRLPWGDFKPDKEQNMVHPGHQIPFWLFMSPSLTNWQY